MIASVVVGYLVLLFAPHFVVPVAVQVVAAYRAAKERFR